MGLPTSSGIYIVTVGGCIAHIGTGTDLSARVGQLARLTTHRGSAEVICAAHCTKMPPVVWFKVWDLKSAGQFEKALKGWYGEPPAPRRRFSRCRHGFALREALVTAAGGTSWEAGYIEAVFDIGNRLDLLFEKEFRHVWEIVGVPPGPWQR